MKHLASLLIAVLLVTGAQAQTSKPVLTNIEKAMAICSQNPMRFTGKEHGWESCSEIKRQWDASESGHQAAKQKAKDEDDASFVNSVANGAAK